MKKILELLCACCLIFLLSTPTQALETIKQPLDQVFYECVVFSYDHPGKAFFNGVKGDIYGNYQLTAQNGHILIPVRMMADLAGTLDGSSSYWGTAWDANNPNEISMINYITQQTLHMEVNSKTILINGQTHVMDNAPIFVNGRIVLPLRSIAEAMGIQASWLDGLVIISREEIDLQNSQTNTIKDKIKEALDDGRSLASDTEYIDPLAYVNGAVYYLKSDYGNETYSRGLYKKLPDKTEKLIPLPGEVTYYEQIVDGKLHFVSLIDDKATLYTFDFETDQYQAVCAITDWLPYDGWIYDIQVIDGQLYLILHFGDCTMGSETAYRLQDGVLQEITSAKSFTGFCVQDDYFYYASFNLMWASNDNLSRVYLPTLMEEKLSLPDVTYSIFRQLTEDGGGSWGGSDCFYLQDGYLYTLGYIEEDTTEPPSVYKTSLDGKTSVCLPLHTNEFYLADGGIDYIDSESGFIKHSDLDGNKQKTLLEEKVALVQWYGQTLYALTEDGNLYQYQNSSMQKLNQERIKSFFIDDVGIYYIVEGYNQGLYSIDEDGKTICLKSDSISDALLCSDGILYTLRYEKGIWYIAK